MKSFLFTVIFLISFSSLPAQKIELLDSSASNSIRGLSIVDSKTAWVSGSQGKVGITLDGGKSWSFNQVENFNSMDFRDIAAFGKKKAIIMGITNPASILKTEDAGQNWKTVFETSDTSLFLDAMLFWNDMSGIVIGDPVDGKFFIGRTFDGGKTWMSIPENYRPSASQGEACFAASGTNIARLDRDEAVFISGGMVSNFYIRDKKIKLPLNQGKTTTGANSVAVHKNTIIVVGGDFNDPQNSEGNCALSFDGGKTWSQPKTGPSGYKSCVAHIKKSIWVACGLTGVDISYDNGLNWKSISPIPFHVVQSSKKGDLVLLAGPKGRIAKLTDY